MPESPTERIVKLERLADVLVERVDNVRREVQSVVDSLKEARAALGEQGRLCIRLEERVVVLDAMRPRLDDLTEVKGRVDQLRDDVDELKEEAREQGKRRWSLLPPIVATVINVILSAVVAYIVASKK